MTEHFVATDWPRFLIGDNIAVRRDSDGALVGLYVTHADGSPPTPIPGYASPTPLLDERCRAPLTVNGVQLWRGW